MESIVKYETALQFLEKIGLVDAEKLLRRDPVAFIQDVIVAYQEHVPFQCISILAQTEKEKHVPTIEEIVEAGLSLEGGVCFTLNTFMCILLQALNFRADVVDGSYSAFGDTHTHVVVLVRDLRCADDNYIVDVGSGFPFQGPLPVSDLPCSRYHAGLEYRYEWRDDDVILRLHRQGDDVSDSENPVMHGEWRQVFHFDLAPVTYEYFRPFMDNIYINEAACDFHSTLRAIRFPPSKETNSDERIMLAFKNHSLLVGPMDNAQKTLVSSEVWADKIKECFPTIPPHKVDLAVQNLADMWKKTE